MKPDDAEVYPKDILLYLLRRQWDKAKRLEARLQDDRTKLSSAEERAAETHLEELYDKVRDLAVEITPLFHAKIPSTNTVKTMSEMTDEELDFVLRDAKRTGLLSEPDDDDEEEDFAADELRDSTWPSTAKSELWRCAGDAR